MMICPNCGERKGGAVDLRKIRQEIVELQSLVYAGENVKAQLTSTAQRMKEIQVDTSIDTRRVENLLIKLQEITEAANHRIEQIVMDKAIAEKEIYLRIDNPKERAVLRYYYLCTTDAGDLMTISDVAKIMKMSKVQIKRIKKSAINKFDTAMGL